MTEQTGYPQRMPFGIGIWEMLILLLVILLVFGPKRLPEMGRSLGKGMREFKESVTGNDDDDEPRPAITTAAVNDETVRPAPERDTVHPS
jgi:sec-independent protein translocase protein TatA